MAYVCAHTRRVTCRLVIGWSRDSEGGRGGERFCPFFFPPFFFFYLPGRKDWSRSATAGNSLCSWLRNIYSRLSQPLTLYRSLFSSSAFVLADNKTRRGRKKKKESCPNQKCQLQHAELSSLSSHNLLPGCFHFIGSAHITHSSTIPPPFFPPPPPSSSLFYALFLIWTPQCFKNACLLFSLSLSLTHTHSFAFVCSLTLSIIWFSPVLLSTFM